MGVYLIRKLLQEKRNHVTLLVRPGKNVSSEQKARDILNKYLGEDFFDARSDRISIVRGDVTYDNLGIDEPAYRDLSTKISTIFHSAASIDFNLPLSEARDINVKGTKNVLEFAKSCHRTKGLQCFNYISTAYVAGSSRNLFNERQIYIGQTFSNTYEQTKCEAEKQVLQELESGLPCIIFRPSIIGSHSITGETTPSNILFDFMRQFCRESLPVFLCEEDSAINIVPIDYFLDALTMIASQESAVGKAFHIVHDTNTKVRAIVHSMCRAAGTKVPEFLPLCDSHLIKPRLLLRLSAILNYVEKSHTFDKTNTNEALQHSGIMCPQIDDLYFQKAYDYCIDTGILKIPANQKNKYSANYSIGGKEENLCLLK